MSPKSTSTLYVVAVLTLIVAAIAISRLFAWTAPQGH